MGGMEIVKAHLESTVGLVSKGLAAGEVYHSVDFDPLCQRVLLAHNPTHVFKDILHLIRPLARIEVQKVMAKNEARVVELAEQSRTAATQKLKQEAKFELTKIGESLLGQLMECMDNFTDAELLSETAPCAKHHGSQNPCYIHPPDGHASRLKDKDYYMAGTSCTDWSSMGLQQSLAGHTVLPFAIELQLIRRKRPRVYFHECTRFFRPAILQTYLTGS